MRGLIAGCLLVGLLALIDAKMTKQFKKVIRPSDGDDGNVPGDQWFHQALDHFDITNHNTWEQRYFVIDEYYRPGGPAFLALEGEWEATAKAFKEMAVVSYARKLNGVVFGLEHRFYGKSRPTSDSSVPNLRYLSADQALMDAAFFIVGMNLKYKLPENPKWILLGGSYAANLAVWMREKFPHLVYASVAYSGPVLAKLNFYEYKTAVRETIADIDKECETLLRQVHVQVKAFLEESKDFEDFTKKFKLCDPMDTSLLKDVQSFLENLSDNLAALVQYNHAWNFSVQTACSIMKNESLGGLVDRYAQVNGFILEEDSKECFDYKYSKEVDKLKDVSWDSEKAALGERQWQYQTCTEFGYFQTSYKKAHYFSEDVPLDYFIQECIDVFGDLFNKSLTQYGIARTNIVFGGQEIKATRVAYVFGKQDPWFPLGITTTRVPESPAIVVEGQAHCVCLYEIKDSDPENVKTSCGQVEALVTQWCAE